MSMELIRAEIKDIGQIRSLAGITFMETYKNINSPEQMEYMMDWMYSEKSLKEQITGSGKYFFLIHSAEGNIGYCSIERNWESEGDKPKYHLQKLYLLPETQGKGYGKQAFNALVEFTKSLTPECGIIELNVNRHNRAVTFYEAMGMKRVREGDFDIGHGYYMNDYIYSLEW